MILLMLWGQSKFQLSQESTSFMNLAWQLYGGIFSWWLYPFWDGRYMVMLVPVVGLVYSCFLDRCGYTLMLDNGWPMYQSVLCYTSSDCMNMYGLKDDEDKASSSWSVLGCGTRFGFFSGLSCVGPTCIILFTAFVYIQHATCICCS